MNVKTWIAGIVLAGISLMLMACAQPAAQQTYQPPQSGVQGTMQSSEDWQVLAQDVSRDIAGMVRQLNEHFPEGLHIQQVYIGTRDDSSFSKALESFMVTDLTHMGVTVKDEPVEAYQVYWSVQNVPHADRKTPRRGATGTEEVIINMTIQDQNQILYRMSNLYDINPLDRAHYHFAKDLYHTDKQVQTRTIEVRAREPRPAALVDTTETVFFEFDEYEIPAEYTLVLDRFAELLRKHPGVPATIEGHTDSLGTKDYNYELSQKRAQAVRDYLVQRNIQPERLETRGHSFLRPVAPNETREGEDNPLGRAKNRRAEMHLLIDQYAVNQRTENR